MKERNLLFFSEINDKVKILFVYWLDYIERFCKEKYCFVNRNDFDKCCMNCYCC